MAKKEIVRNIEFDRPPDKTVNTNGKEYLVISDFSFDRLSVIIRAGYRLQELNDGFYQILDLYGHKLFFSIGDKMLYKIKSKIQELKKPS